MTSPVVQVELVCGPSDDLLRTAAPALVRLRRSGYREFPPARLDDLFDDEAGQLAVYADWLCASDPAPVVRLVEAVDGRVVGHVAACTPHPYLDEATGGLGDCLEVSRLFVDPLVHGTGVGGRLLAAVTAEIAALDATGVLAVLEESQAAQRMYRSHGWEQRGTFYGTQGLNRLMVLPSSSIASTLNV